MLTKQECQRKLFTLGIKLGVSPKLIATRLLSEEDKHDMVNGLIPDDSLVTSVKIWVEAGMPNYAEGSQELYKQSFDLPMRRYRGIGKNV
jgi:hypothetical protein